MSAAPRKLLFVGLEMGDGRLIRRWCEQGHLPVLRSLMESGTWAWLKTTAEELHVSAWPTLYTGTSPGQHGVYYTFQPARGVQGYRRFGVGQYGRPTFWRVLSEAGRRCTVFDAPYTHPEPGFRGIQVFDWGSWAQYLGPKSTPGAMLGRLKRQCGAYPLGLEAHDIGLVHLDPEDMSRRLVHAADAKLRAAAWLMEEAPWDLFLVVPGETHPAAHYCWTPPQENAPADDQPRMRGVYEAIDRGLGTLLARAGDDTTVLVASGEGVGPNHCAWHLLPEVLRRLGFLAMPEADPAADRALEPDAAPGRDPVKAVRDLLPKDLRKAIARRLPTRLRDALAQRVDFATIDWSRTQAYCLPTDLEGYIRINLKGREPRGIVEEGGEYRDVCRRIISELEQLTDPASGRPAVARVVRTDDAFPGPMRDRLPDLVVIWTREAPFSGLASPAVGTVSGPSPDPRPGTHVPPGFLLARGPGIGKGGTVEGAHILDLAPTVLAAFGVDVPAHVEGRVLTDIAMR